MSSETSSQQVEYPGFETPTLPPTDPIHPQESDRHRKAIDVLIRSLNQAWADRNDFYAGGNMAMYYCVDQAMNRDYRAPDFFVVLRADGKAPRKRWVAWDEGGLYPDLIVEFTSPATENLDKTIKKHLYNRIFSTRNYFTFDPYVPNSLEGWKKGQDFDYHPLVPNEQGWLWSNVLGLWLGTCPGTIDGETADWLRFYDQAGNLQMLPEEPAQRLIEQEKQRADRLAAQLRALGVEPEV